MNEVYEYKTTVTIGDTNALQNMYFLNFFKLQGIVRELWVKNKVKNGFEDLSNGMILITKDARCNFKKNLFLYDDITIKLYISNVGRTNMRLNFKFFNTVTNALHAEGNQTIVFADSTHKIIQIPQNWKEAINQVTAEEPELEVCES